MYPKSLAVQLAAWCFLCGALPFVTGSAYADDTEPDPQDAWKFTAGLGVGSRPVYTGSADSKLAVLPLVSASYGRFFVGGAEGGTPFSVGMRLLQTSHWTIATSVSYDFFTPRDQSDDPRLNGLGDVKRTAHAHVFSTFTQDWLMVRGSVSTDIGGQHEGTTASLAVLANVDLTDRLRLTAGPGITWSSSQANQTLFGVDSIQSSASGFPVYRASSGISSYQFSTSLEYKIDRQWSAGVLLNVSRLGSAVNDSPIVEKSTQITYGASLKYRF